MSNKFGGLRAWVAHRRNLLVILSSGALLLLGWAAHLIGGQDGLYGWLMTGSALVSGLPIAFEAVGKLTAKQFSIALLVTVATAGALWIGEPWEAAAVTFLYILGGYLESLTLARTRAALRDLVDLSPRVARVKRDGTTIEVVRPDEVKPGEIVVVLPGDKVPVDGLVISGQAAVDTSALTGEPLPVETAAGDNVLGGSVSRGGYLEIEAVRVGVDTTFSRLIYLVAEAQEQKPKVQRLLDGFAQWYTPSVISAAVVVYIITRDLRLALTFLVIACPGALVVAAPVATVAGLGRAARQGIMIKGGERLERVGKVDVVAFDKTGTLTVGRPRVQSVIPFSGEPDSVLALAAAAEQRSEHHLAAAILEHARERGITPVVAHEWRLEPGMGAVAHSDGGEILVGNVKLLERHGVTLTPQESLVVKDAQSSGTTIAVVAFEGRPVGLIGITDPLRPKAAESIRQLRVAGVRRTVMLTGDNEGSAMQVARRVDVDETRAGLLPGDKVAAIRELQVQGHVVAMVGDGVNDAPALATADVSIAMGASGTQTAIEAADIALMTDRLELVPYAIGFSRRILRIVRQNVTFAVAVVILLLLGVLGRVVHLAGGMLIHEASILLVIANGMRLLGDSKARAL